MLEKLVEIRQLELASCSVRDANPPSQFVETSRAGNGNNRTDAVSFDDLGIS